MAGLSDRPETAFVKPELTEETERLRRSWDCHPEEMLRDYMVAGIHDPRLNPQSIRSRHLLIEALFGERFIALEEEELHGAAVLKWLLDFSNTHPIHEDWDAIEHGLARGADNGEGIPLPAHIWRTFARLPAQASGVTIPNYLREALQAARGPGGAAAALHLAMDTFPRLWRTALANATAPKKISVLEAACGSANDYRAVADCSLDAHLDYTGFDLCAKNVVNARKLFPRARFEEGNVFAIPHPDKAFDFCFAHDLLEHLSLTGLERAVAEMCRVTRRAVFVGFFQMHEAGEHIVRPVEEYHWNTLSLPRVRELFERYGAQTQAVHVNTWWQTLARTNEELYYETAYDLLCWFPEGNVKRDE